jgi:hypothetical protein
LSVVYFTDRDLGLTFPTELRAAGLPVELHREHFPPTAPDHEWLASVTKVYRASPTELSKNPEAAAGRIALSLPRPGGRS